jgi:hypothetical protein
LDRLLIALVQWKLGFTGLVLMTMVLMGMRAGHPRLAGWAVFVLFLLTLQLLA